MRWLALLAWGWCSLGLAAETMRYCDYPVYPPVSWSDGQAVRGLAPQVVKRVLQELGYEMQVVVLGNWKRCLMDAASGRVDLVLAYRTGERQRHLAFAEAPVLREEVALFYNRHKPLAVKRLADLAGYRGGLLFGESYGTEFDRFVTRQGRIEYVSDSRQNFGKLIRQRIDFIPYERRTGRLFVAGMPGGEAIVDAPEPLAVDALRLAVSRRSPLLARLDDIDRILLALQADGSLQRWLEESERDYRTQGRPLEGTSKNVGEAVSARQKQAKKRSLRSVNEHFEPVFNAAMATQVVFRDALEAP